MASDQTFAMPDMPTEKDCIIDIVGVFVHVSKNETSGPTLFPFPYPIPASPFQMIPIPDTPTPPRLASPYTDPA